MFAAIVSRFRRTAGSHPPRRDVSFARPRLEALEERAAPAGLGGAGGASPVDFAFLQHSAQGNEQEIVLGAIAMQNAANPAVRQFGQTLVSDHLNALYKEIPVLQQAGLPPLLPLGQDQMQAIQQFQGLQGFQFDLQFAVFMTTDHVQDLLIGSLEQQLGSFTPAVNYAAQDAPVLQKHLSIAESLVTQLTGINLAGFLGNGSNASNSGSGQSNSGSNQSGNGNSGS